MLKNIWSYRGFRVRKLYKHIRFILISLIVMPFLVAIGFYLYHNQVKVIAQPIQYGLMISIVPLVLIPMVLLIVLKLETKSLLVGRLRSLYLMQRYLFEHNLIYPKKKNGKESYKFPKAYLKQDKFGLDVTLEMRGSKFQDKFNKLGGELEDTFDGDFMFQTRPKGFVSYRIAIDRFSNRIKITDVKVTKKGLRLMKDIYWDFDEQPHLLCAGGKTVLLMSIIYGLLSVADVDICDPKQSDFVSLAKAPVFKERVFSEKEAMIACLRDNVVYMENRYEYMTNHAENQAGKKYSDYGLRPKFIVFDEWAAFISLIDNDYKLVNEVTQLLTQIVLKGRQAGVFMILAMQRPDGEFIKTALRDNFMKRISVGVLEDTGYMMMYGDANRNKSFKNITEINGEKVRGRGYCANGGQTAGEFYAPYVPYDKGWDFLKVFQEMPVLSADLVPFKSSFLIENQSTLDTSTTIPNQTETTLSIQAYAQSVNKSFDQVRNVIGVIEKNAYHQFSKVDGKVVLEAYEQDLLSAIFEAKANSNRTYQEIAKEMIV
ncbi:MULTISPECIES: cell division protein FtsK [unclassified Enterococcus]|uniref:cell division protein FtsK n=1 Tax=unclassified Enterococcus TaxID=2608891 RepID=UPI00201B3AA8|nr:MULTISPECIES: cell division protein FtsK [unclassified Enterococcus]